MKTIETGSRPETCILCGSAASSPVYGTPPRALVRCSGCGLVRVAPMPDAGSRREVNLGTYSTEEYRRRYFLDRKIYSSWFRKKLELIERFKPGRGRILDIGCSYGFFVEEALGRGWDAFGCEINPVTGGYSRGRLGERVHVGGPETIPFGGQGFDAIVMWDVIEHQPDPLSFLEGVKKYLKPGGVICLQVPNFGSYISELKKENWDWLTPGDHLYFFTPDTLGRLAGRAGLRQSHSETWESLRYFIDSLLGYNERRGALAELYRATVVRAVRLGLFFLFLPFQRRLHREGKGALILSVLSSPGGKND